MTTIIKSINKDYIHVIDKCLSEKIIQYKLPYIFLKNIIICLYDITIHERKYNYKIIIKDPSSINNVTIIDDMFNDMYKNDDIIYHHLLHYDKNNNEYYIIINKNPISNNKLLGYTKNHIYIKIIKLKINALNCFIIVYLL